MWGMVMSEKRFKVLSGGFDEEGNPLYLIKDTTDMIADMIGDYEICKKVIEQQSTIKEQNKEIEEWEFSFRTEMAHHRIAEKELKEKIKEKQSIIEDLKKENEELKKDNSLLRKYIKGCIKHRDLYRERLINGGMMNNE